MLSRWRLARALESFFPDCRLDVLDQIGDVRQL